MTLILPLKLDQSYRVEGKREYLKNLFYSCNLTSGCSAKSKIGNRGNTEVKHETGEISEFPNWPRFYDCYNLKVFNSSANYVLFAVNNENINSSAKPNFFFNPSYVELTLHSLPDFTIFALKKKVWMLLEILINILHSSHSWDGPLDGYTNIPLLNATVDYDLLTMRLEKTLLVVIVTFVFFLF